MLVPTYVLKPDSKIQTTFWNFMGFLRRSEFCHQGGLLKIWYNQFTKSHMLMPESARTEHPKSPLRMHDQTENKGQSQSLWDSGELRFVEK